MEPVLTAHFRPDGEALSRQEYEAAGGYSALRKALTMSPGDVAQVVLDADVRGRGGAGYPAGKKWSAFAKVEEADRPRLLFVNFDEMEPGTFKDRFLVEHNPHQLIEGLLIAAYACEIDLGYIFIRAEYLRSRHLLQQALAEAAAAGYWGEHVLGSDWSFVLHLHVSAGRYMCGEAMALLNAMQGERAIPRAKPPHAASSGAWGKPSLVNNVETLCCMPHVINHGADWFRNLGKGDDTGPKIYGISGRVRRPGCYELPLGTSLRELLEEHAGGMCEGYGFKAALPGGASTMYLDATEMDVPLGFEGLKQIHCYFGTGCVVVIDDRTCVVGATGNMQQFFARESCGWCTPCRDGLPWIERIYADLEAGRGTSGDLELLADLIHHIHSKTFCLLATGAAVSIESSMKKFRADYEQHVALRRCPVGSVPS